MVNRTCPKCGTSFPDDNGGWAQSAISMLVPAPAVRDMATQARCPKCQYVFADSEVRFLSASGLKAVRTVIWFAIAALLAWAALS